MTTEAKDRKPAHTPGPWVIVDEDPIETTDDGFLIAAGSDDGYRVCVVYGDPPDTDYPCAEANAHLIKAAPDLLAALTNALVAMGRAGANADTKHPLRGAWEDARAAIAKAGSEGRSRAKRKPRSVRQKRGAP
jgi:ABC-type nitrate/sulfonate/bicarbonate transport system substrate-binding protein